MNLFFTIIENPYTMIYLILLLFKIKKLEIQYKKFKIKIKR